MSEDMAEFGRLCATKTREELLQMICDGQIAISVSMDRWRDQMRTKPIYGGVFGGGGFVVASHSFVLKGLDRVDYHVMDEVSGLIASTADTYAKAVKGARELLANIVDPVQWKVSCGVCSKAVAAQRTEILETKRKAWEARRAEILAKEPQPENTVKSISRRRKRIFDESDGKCHYCGVALTLDGKWHVEHKMPKALGGGDEPGNLVASCVPCNHEKIDTTDIEYKAKRAARVNAINGRAA